MLFPCSMRQVALTACCHVPCFTLMELPLLLVKRSCRESASHAAPQQLVWQIAIKISCSGNASQLLLLSMMTVHMAAQLCSWCVT